MHYLQWENAWKGRLRPPKTSLDFTQEIVSKLQEAKTKNLSPFISMDYQEELKLSLNATLPLLARFKHMLLLGIGGSALGAKALRQAFFPRQDQPNHTGKCLWIIDNVDGDYLNAIFSKLNPKETLVVVISKSGETIETIAQYLLAKEWLKNTLGENWKKQFICVTDPEEGFLKEESQRYQIQTLPVPKNLGGRYSILSAVGLLPAAFLSIPWEELLAGAETIMRPLNNPTIAALQKHPARAIAEWCLQLIQKQYSQLILFTYIPQWSMFGQWFTQLWAESLGKEGQGSMPIPAVGVTDQHSTQQMFLDGPKDKGCILLSGGLKRSGLIFPETLPPSWSVLQNRYMNELLDAERIGAAAALTTKDVPLLQLTYPETSCRAAGAFVALCMASTLFTGWLLDVNPLDQPAVELGKRLTRIQLGENGSPSDTKILHNFLQKTPS